MGNETTGESFRAQVDGIIPSNSCIRRRRLEAVALSLTSSGPALGSALEGHINLSGCIRGVNH
jgi:hypothetical protein